MTLIMHWESIRLTFFYAGGFHSAFFCVWNSYQWLKKLQKLSDIEYTKGQGTSGDYFSKTYWFMLFFMPSVKASNTAASQVQLKPKLTTVSYRLQIIIYSKTRDVTAEGFLVSYWIVSSLQWEDFNVFCLICIILWQLLFLQNVKE